MTADAGAGSDEDGAPAPGGAGSEIPSGEAAAAPTSADRWILAAFAVYAVLLMVAAYAQLTDNRALLDLFDLKRFFTR